VRPRLGFLKFNSLLADLRLAGRRSRAVILTTHHHARQNGNSLLMRHVASRIECISVQLLLQRTSDMEPPSTVLTNVDVVSTVLPEVVCCIKSTCCVGIRTNVCGRGVSSSLVFANLAVHVLVLRLKIS
jgi:hypothetical protein